MKDTLIIGGHEFHSRFILGSGKYSLEKMPGVIENSGAEIITLALRRANTGGDGNILDYLPKGITLLPNTSGARNAEEHSQNGKDQVEICKDIFVNDLFCRL